MLRKTPLIYVLAAVVMLGIAAAAYAVFFAPTKILVVNALPAQQAELVLGNESSRISVDCVAADAAADFSHYDAVVMFGRGLYLDSLQLQQLHMAADKGIPVFTKTSKNFTFGETHNLTPEQADTLSAYFNNPCKGNYANMLRYLRHIATPNRPGDQSYEPPVALPSDMFYHIQPGKYFTTASQLTGYLKKQKIYNDKGLPVALISGVTFPVESNRAHVDTIIERLTAAGYNVYPITASGSARTRLLKELNPAAIVYFPMGRLGNDSLINWCGDHNIPIFSPFPLTQPREEWLDAKKALGGGSLNARVVIPEIDGAMTPICIASQSTTPEGFIVYKPEKERVDAFMELFTRFMRLREKPNAQKRVAIGYFKSPGNDAMRASGMEVIPSLYNFLKRLRTEGYDVAGLPPTLEAFQTQMMKEGAVRGDYAPGAQKEFMATGNPTWVSKTEYEKWAREVLVPSQYAEVERRYGKAPGSMMAQGDSIAFAAVRYGNIMLFPQPRPALGNDEFKLVHGVDVVPPHSYLAPYLYVNRKFDADALIHFGTHGNLEFTPGKNVALSQTDWADVLIGNRPHFYFYTTANVGEAVIAKRRSHAVMVTYLTPPYVESGQREKYASLIEDVHAALRDKKANTLALKKEIIKLGIHKDLALTSPANTPYSEDELEQIDAYIEELSNDKVTGACYTLGEPYNAADMATTVTAITADRIAYDRASADCKQGRISAEQLHDLTFIRHHYLPGARKAVNEALAGRGTPEEVAIVADCRDLLQHSTTNELNTMTGLLSGRPARPVPGGDPVANPNVLPTGRNMYGVNAEMTPGKKAWEEGKRLADATVDNYLKSHGEYPKRVSYSFWAGEFITSQGATIAQALRMLGVEPVRDEKGRVVDIKLTPSKELGRPRINIMVQISGQLRDIAASRLQLLTDAVKLASEARDDEFPNYVAEGTEAQEREMVEKGTSPKRARELSTMRVFGPLNSGYGTGMLHYTEASGEWEKRGELADGYLNNMCAMYGDTTNWGTADRNALVAAVKGTDVIVQPRQSNTWGPVSLDHVYEFTGSLSLVATELGGKEPDAVMADYRNVNVPRMQDARTAVATEMRTTLLNPQFVKKRMKGDATTAQAFGEMFRNVFGWSVMRQSVLNDDTYDELYRMYVKDVNKLGIEQYFDRVNPAALQEMTGTMLESARKGYWKPTAEQLSDISKLHARITARNGAPCTEFVCGNAKLQSFIARQLPAQQAEAYRENMSKAISSSGAEMRLKKETLRQPEKAEDASTFKSAAAIAFAAILGLIIIFLIVRRKHRSYHDDNI